jgi:hypothetical protein
VTVAFSGAAQVEEVVQSAREHKAEDDVRSQLGHRVAVSADGPNVFLSAATEGRAPEADGIVREALAKHQMTAEFALDRWHRSKRTGWTRAPRRRKPPSNWQRRTNLAWRTRPRSPSRPGQARYKVPAHSPAPPVVLGSAVRESRPGSPALRTPPAQLPAAQNRHVRCRYQRPS